MGCQNSSQRIDSDISIGHWPDINRREAAQKARQLRRQYDLVPPRGYTFNDAYALWKSLQKRRDRQL